MVLDRVSALRRRVRIPPTGDRRSDLSVAAYCHAFAVSPDQLTAEGSTDRTEDGSAD